MSDIVGVAVGTDPVAGTDTAGTAFGGSWATDCWGTAGWAAAATEVAVVTGTGVGEKNALEGWIGPGTAVATMRVGIAEAVLDTSRGVGSRRNSGAAVGVGGARSAGTQPATARITSTMAYRWRCRIGCSHRTGRCASVKNDMQLLSGGLQRGRVYVVT
jgi:hypothetical protein